MCQTSFILAVDVSIEMEAAMGNKTQVSGFTTTVIVVVSGIESESVTHPISCLPIRLLLTVRVTTRNEESDGG